MNRKNFFAFAGMSLFAAGGIYYLSTDKRNFVRNDISEVGIKPPFLLPDEANILYLASLAPSGHNAQPWLVKYIAPFHWIICNDKDRWLLGVDPTQRETLLSIGAFLQNLEFAANESGYACHFTQLATTNQAEEVVSVTLTKANHLIGFDTQKIIQRRTVRSHYLGDLLQKKDLDFLLNEATETIQYIPNTTKEHRWLNEQTIEANRLQAYRDAAEKELADWIRFSSKDAKAHSDGLTLASMEIDGVAAWYLRNFYGKADVMKKGFREKSIDTAKAQVATSAGWLLITSDDYSVASLLETGKRLQRLLLKIRERNIAIHPMTQILEETATAQMVQTSLGITQPIQFILRVGYLAYYPEPVSLRRPVDKFIILNGA